MKRPFRLQSVTGAKVNICHVMEVHWVMGDLHMCEGTIDVEAYIGIVQSIYCIFHRKCLDIRSRQGLILHVLQQHDFVDTCM